MTKNHLKNIYTFEQNIISWYEKLLYALHKWIYSISKSYEYFKIIYGY